jgi:hypothetical protein
MAKGGFASDTFEKLAELGTSTVKKSASAVKQTFDPIKIVEKVMGIEQPKDKGVEKLEKGQSKKQNHTPLDLKKLQSKYEDQDKVKEQILRQHLFQLVRRSGEDVVERKKQEEMEKKRKVAYEVEDKKRKEEEKKRLEQMQTIPMGKVRRSIFSPKKVAKREQAEVKPATGKQ